MINLDIILDAILADNNFTLKSLQSNKLSKMIVLDNIIKYGAINGVPKEPLFKQIRALGVSFPNELGRKIYDDSLIEQNKYDYARKLRGNALPKIDKIPVMKNAKRGIRFMYAANVYLYDGDFENIYRVPKGTRLLGSENFFNETSEYFFWTDELLTKDEVIDKMFRRMNNADFQYVYNVEQGSDPFGLGTLGDDLTIIGIKFDRVLRAW